MSDREELYDLQVRYGRATDTHDVHLIRTCIDTTVTATYEPWGEPLEGYDAFMAQWIAGLEPMQTSHHFSNFAYEIEGDTGAYSCLVIAQHWKRGVDGFRAPAIYTVGGRYENHVRRTQSGWRITRLLHRGLWSSGDASVLGHL